MRYSAGSLPAIPHSEENSDADFAPSTVLFPHPAVSVQVKIVSLPPPCKQRARRSLPK